MQYAQTHGVIFMPYALCLHAADERAVLGIHDERVAGVQVTSSEGEPGSSVNIMTMETEYKLVFGIYPPNPGEKLRAENCFKR